MLIFQIKRGDFMCECEFCRRKRNRSPLNRDSAPKN
ncbi:spore coat protein, partial [Bacillus wiedmannii]